MLENTENSKHVIMSRHQNEKQYFKYTELKHFMRIQLFDTIVTNLISFTKEIINSLNWGVLLPFGSLSFFILSAI